MNYSNDKAQGQVYGNNIAGLQMQQGCEARQTAKGALRDRVRRLRRQADELEALLKALPEELPADADRALWDITIGQR